MDAIREANESLAAGMDPDHWPCQRDADLYCSGVPRGGGRINACLEDHARDLSAGCAQYREVTDGPEDWVLACDAELHSVCSGRFHQLDCLKEHPSDLSSHCQSRIRAYETAERWRRACFDDSARFCPGLDGDLAKSCLQQHQAELSTSCKIYYMADPVSGR
jgi:hypothetical protein